MTERAQLADRAALAISETVWRTRQALLRDPRERGRCTRLVVLAGHQLWEDLLKRPETNDSTGPWSYRDGPVLRVVDAEVHPVDVPLVERSRLVAHRA